MDKVLNLILKGEPIIVPTDTVYGLVCRYDSKSAIEKIYKLKKRSRKKPLILLGYNWNALKKFVIYKKNPQSPILNPQSLILNPQSSILNSQIKWPGPLTIVLPISKRVPKFLNKGFKTIGVRVPNNTFLLKLLKHCPGRVLASTSANISGKSNRHPQKELIKKVNLFIRAKRKEMSFKPSRIIEITKRKIKILR